jgi:3-oxoacyl-[acyl-carrier-protein] synthase-3
VVSRRSGFARLLTVCSSSRPDLEVLNRGLEPIFPPSCTLGKPADFEALMATHDGETLQKAMLEIGPLYGEVWKQALDEAGINASDITRLAHQNTGSEQHLRLMTEPLGLEPGQGILRWGQENGRGGACDQIGALDHVISEGELRPGDYVALLSSGPGMVVSCAIIQMTETPAWVAQ